jgi:homoserine O-acetyltransferase/O-succinyltransferase
MTITRAFGLLLAGLMMIAATSASAQDMIVDKKVFELSTFTMQSGRTLKNVKVGWEAYGTLNADKSNVVLICHFFSATSHAAGKYAAADAAPGYWDAIIGPGKAIDTNRFYVVSVDSLVNLNVGDPKVTTTGPASIDPDTGKPYGMTFPVTTIRDFVEVQKALLDSLGIGKLVMVGGASMGALQTYEWAATYPDRMTRIMPVIAYAEADAHLISWLDVWAMPIRLDPNWNNGDYYGRTPPNAGLAAALKVVTLHANHTEWANATFGRKPAKEGVAPGSSLDAKYAIEATLDGVGAARAKTSDANHFLYLAKANQTFVAGGAASLEEAVKKIKARTLLITSPKDQVFHAAGVDRMAKSMRAAGVPLDHLELVGNRGHLDGVLSIKQFDWAIEAFLK